jgi:integrase
MFRVGHVQRQESFPDKASADGFCRLCNTVGGEAAYAVLEARRNVSADMPTLAEFTYRYLDPGSGLLTGIEPGTRSDYRKRAEHSFLPMLGEYPVDTITKADVGRWLAWFEAQPSPLRKGETYAAKTVRDRHGLLSSIFSAAVSEKLRPDNPAYRMRLSKGLKREAVFLSADEFTTLLHFIPDYYQSFVLFLAGTGCRWGEATAVMWGAVNLSAKTPTVRIDKAWKKGEHGPVLKQPKSQKSRRTIGLSSDVVHALGKRRASDAFVFPGKRGGHLWYSGFRQLVWEPAVDKAMDAALCENEGLTPLTMRPHIHDLRHSHASWLIAAGVPLPYIQARLGHESVNTTVGVYGHLVPDAHATMADVIGDTLIGVRPIRQLAAIEASDVDVEEDVWEAEIYGEEGVA